MGESNVPTDRRPRVGVPPDARLPTSVSPTATAATIAPATSAHRDRRPLIPPISPQSTHARAARVRFSAGRSAAGIQPIHGALKRRGVDVPGVVLAERAQRRDLDAERPVVGGPFAGDGGEAPQVAGAEVAVEVTAVERGQ